MKTESNNKWGLVFNLTSPIISTKRYHSFREFLAVGYTLTICGVAFGEMMGIKESFYEAFKWSAFACFILAVFPIILDMIIDAKEGKFNITSLVIILFLIAFAFFVLLFNW